MSVGTNETSIKLGTVLPPFSLKNVDGCTLGSRELSKDRLLCVIFSCNHCPYVQGQEDRMIELQREFGSKGFQIVCINANDDVNYPEDSFEEMVKRHRQKGFNFPYLHDATQQVARAFGATHTPEVFLFGRDGRLAYHGRIDDSPKDPKRVQSWDLRNAVESILAGKVPPSSETYSIGCTIKWK